MHWTTSIDIEYPIYVLLVAMSPKFHSVSLYDQPFSRCRPFCDNCTKWHWTLQGQRYDIDVLISQSLKFHPIFLHDQTFWDTKLSIIGHAPNDLKMIWTFNRETSPVSIKYNVPTSEVQFFVCIALQPSVFKVPGCWKSEISEMYWMTSDWLWNLNSQKYLIYIK